MCGAESNLRAACFFGVVLLATMLHDSKVHSAPWYERAFRGDYLARYKHRSDKLARAELPFVIRALRLPAYPTILDLCCGAGRHARGLARILPKARVIGLDLSSELLRAAQARNQARRRLCFLRGDMRRLPLRSGSVDGVMNLFTSFVYFKTDREHLAVLKEVARVLKTRGRFVLDFFNRERVLATLVARSEFEERGKKIVTERRFDRRSGRIIKTIRMAHGDAACESVRAYTSAELKRLLVRAGLRTVKLYGDLNGGKYHSERSLRCVWVCEKH